MPDWSIKIVPAKNQKPGVLAEFVADAPDAEPGTFDVETGRPGELGQRMLGAALALAA